jgi:uncharacterized Zn finger protein (UPF0148 family)
MHDSCDCCACVLERFEGETCCPECCRVEALRLAEQADDEARLVRLAESAGPAEEEPSGDRPPF